MSVGYERNNRMGGPVKRFYDFGAFRIDANKRLLLKDGEPVALTSKAFDTLLVLVENRGELVSKDELMSRLWPDTVVEEGSLTRNIYLLRKALGEARGQHLYIVTIPGQGYRFVADVCEISEESLDLRVTERTRTMIVVSEEETEDRDEELLELPPAPNTARAELPAPAIGVQALEVSQAGRPSIVSRKPVIIICALAVLAALAAAIWLYVSGGSRQAEAKLSGSAQGMAITNLTTTGNVVCAGVSPDGNYVAYARADNLKQSSLWIMQLATFTGQMIIPPAEVQFHALTFSPDGDYIYYVMRENNAAPRALYRVPILGGPSKKLNGNVETAVSFSPDGSQIVYRRSIGERRSAALFVSNADGSGEREIAWIKHPDGIGDPAWSPDGKTIVCASGHSTGGTNMYLAHVPAEGGTIEPVSSQKWRWIGRLAWLPDSSGLVMVASDSAAAPYQVWRLDYPSGEARKITNDSLHYNNLTMSADANTLVAMQRQLNSKIWSIPAEDASRAKEITFGMGGYGLKLSWTPDGKIVYDSSVNNVPSISIMEADGSNPKNLMGDMTGRARAGSSTVSPDGRYIIYSSDLTGTRHIWRMNIDGSNPVQLTDGVGEEHPTCSPDGKSVFYVSLSIGEPALWRVSIDGGEPVKLIDTFVEAHEVSPDGKLIAALFVDNENIWRLGVFPVEGGKPAKVFPNPVQGTTAVRWTPDGRNITYSENPIGTSKIWIQPLDGGPPRKFAEIETDKVFDLEWSPDGRQLACIRGIWARNMALIKNFR